MTDITATEHCECLAALYAKRYGRLAPGKDDRLQDSSSVKNRCQFGLWTLDHALNDAIARIVELERELAAARAALEGEPR